MRNEIIAILRESATEQATISQIRAAVKHDATPIGVDMLNKILEDMQADDAVKLDEHGHVHLLLGGDSGGRADGRADGGADGRADGGAADGDSVAKAVDSKLPQYGPHTPSNSSTQPLAHSPSHPSAHRPPYALAD